MTAPRKPASPPGGRSAAALADALHDCAGNVTVAAQRLGMARGALAERIAKSDYLRGIIEDEREKTVDMAETRLRNAIARPDEKINMDAVKFALTSPRAAARGWGKPSAAADPQPAAPKPDTPPDPRSMTDAELAALNRMRLGIAQEDAG